MLCYKDKRIFQKDCKVIKVPKEVLEKAKNLESNLEQDVDVQDLPKLLYNTRKKRGLTLAEVSEQTGLTISTLSRIENGVFKPRADTFITVLKWLELETSKVTDVAHSNKKVQDTMSHIAAALKEDPKLSKEAVRKILSAWRPMYDIYAADRGKE